MKEAMFYKNLEKMKVQCNLCPNNCIILHGKRGICNVRENKAGVLYTTVYGLPCTAGTDPIEKKPLFHFLPGTNTFSIATQGCNLHCMWCQNWKISQRGPEEVDCFEMSPEQIIKAAKKAKCKSISYTYVEPSIFYEYMLDTAKLAKAAGLKNIMITNGYINKEPAKELFKYIDACNIDLKGFTEEIYKKYCSGKLKPVLETMILAKKMKVWLELTTLILPKINDSDDDIRDECKWIKKELGANTPIHFSRFFPYYKMTHLPPTEPETLKRAYEIAKETGLKYVYVGNIQLEGTEDTFCSKCNTKLIDRNEFFTVSSNKIKAGKCPKCKTVIPGVFSTKTTKKVFV